jgi:predicted 3-demethylubiquinone-9 3-methyltransferase (glyoxalase superfamily)
MIQKITPFLWFDNEAEEAATFYTSIFPDSKILTVTPGPHGAAMTVGFQLAGLKFTALNGGPLFKFTEAISLLVHCENQQEVDHYWEKLSDGSHEQCGWLKDKFGLSWQIIPKALIEMLKDKDPQRSQRVMKAMMQMKKIDIGALAAAYRG